MSKRTLVGVFCVLLVLAFASSVFAETKLSFSGTYRVRGWYVNNLTLQDDSDNEDKSSYFDHRFRLDVKLMPAENLTLHVKLQALKDNKWGTQSSGLNWANKPGSLGGGAGDAEYNSSFEMYKVFMAIRTKFGIFDLGRQSGGVAGLAVLNVGASPVGADRFIFDGEGSRDRIKWTFAVGKFVMLAVYEKDKEQDSIPALNVLNEQELDKDNFYLLPIYQFENGAVNCLFAYVRDRSTMTAKSDIFSVNPALSLKFGPIELATEMKWVTGSMKSDFLGLDMDLEGAAYYFEGAYNYGSGKIGAYYLWLQGDDDVTDDKVKGLTRSGADFIPLLIAYDIGLSTWNLCDQANHWTFGLWWNHNLTESLLLQAAYGYIKINETEMFGPNVDDSYGSEIDFGLLYNFMENLSYEVRLGYFMPGDFHKFGGNGDLGNAFAFKHTLTMSF